MKSICDDTFEHHGIKGQKWGERNGPPYPLEENSGSNSSGKHGGDKKKSGSAGSSGSSGKHRLLSLFTKREKKTKEVSGLDRLKIQNVFKKTFSNMSDDEAAEYTERYLKRANNDRQLALNLFRWDLNRCLVTGNWKEHEPKELPRYYRNIKDRWE